MNLFMRALSYLKHNVGKVILVFFVTILSMIIISVCLFIAGANASVEKVAGENQQPLATISTDANSLNQTLGLGGVEFTIDQYKSLTDIEQITDLSLNVEAISSNSSYQYESEDFQYIDLMYEQEFIENLSEQEGYQFTVDEERFAASPNGVILNETFLTNNNLHVGDEITMAIGFAAEVDESVERYNQKLEIVGSYVLEPTADMKKSMENMANTYGIEIELLVQAENIYGYINEAYSETLFDLYSAFTEEEKNELSVVLTPIYTIDSEDSKKIIEQQASELLGTEVELSLQSQVNAEEYGFLLYFADFTTSIIIPVTIIISLLATIIITFFIRNRKTEFGILMALGEKRIRIFIQIFCEVWIQFLISATISIPLGYFFGNAINQSVTELLLGASVPNIEFSIIAVISIYGVATLLALITTLIPTLYTLRLNPNKILI